MIALNFGLAAAACAVAAASAVAAAAEPITDASTKAADNATFDQLTSRYGNTVIVSAAGRMETKLLYNEDGTLTVSEANAALKAVKWSRAAGQFCLTFVGGATRCGALDEEPEALVMSALAAPDAKAAAEQEAAKSGAAAPAEAAKAKRVGDAWVMTLPGGEKMKVRIVAGR